MGSQMLRQINKTIRRRSGSSRIRTVITKITYVRDIFKGTWNLELIIGKMLFFYYYRFSPFSNATDSRHGVPCNSKTVQLQLQK
jgi:hypothetical protein